MKIKVDDRIAEEAALGGAFFGGGGGGDLYLGLKHAKLAVELGEVIIVDVDNIPTNKYIATVSMVGAPAAKEAYILPTHFIKSTELFIKTADIPIGGLISSENGGYSTINGWLQSATLEIPIVDAPADGRAHPMGIMGALGLHRVPGYISTQTATGGNREKGQYIEIIVKGSLEETTKLIREAAIQAGGLVAVTRNYVSPTYIKENAAVGALTQAIEVGKIIQENSSDVYQMINKIIKYLGAGEIIDSGEVEETKLETRGGFDLGIITRKGRKRYRITFWNEFLKLEDSEGKKYAIFPDLINIIDLHRGLPLTSANIKKGEKVVLLMVPKESLLLGTGVRDPKILRQVEEINKYTG